MIRCFHGFCWTSGDAVRRPSDEAVPDRTGAFRAGTRAIDAASSSLPSAAFPKRWRERRAERPGTFRGAETLVSDRVLCKPETPVGHALRAARLEGAAALATCFVDRAVVRLARGSEVDARP